MANLWIFTTDGFYSPRKDEYCGEDEVMIRTRAYGDLVALADSIGIELPEIIKLPDADYLYRMKIKQDDWNMYCVHAAMDHSEGDGIKESDDVDRYLTYLRIWELMYQFQRVKDAQGTAKYDNEKEVLMEMVWPDFGIPIKLTKGGKYEC